MRPTSEFLYEMIHRLPTVKFNLAGSTPPNLFTAEELAIQPSLSDAERAETHARFAEKMRRILHFEAENHAIQFSCGASQAFTQSLAALTEPGDTVVMEAPYYEPFLRTAQFLNLKVKHFNRTGVFDEDLRHIRRLASKKRILAITNPHFPLARMYDERQLRKLASLFKFMIIDEVFLPMFTVGERATMFTGELPPNVVVTGGYAKALGLGSLRLGWIASRRTLAERIEKVGYHFHIDMPLPTLLVAERALSLWHEKIQQYEDWVRPNRELLRSWLAEYRPSRSIFSHDLTRGHFVMIRTPVRARRFVQEMIKDDILLRDGTIFGLPYHVRLHFFLNPHDFAHVWERVTARLGRP